MKARCKYCGKLLRDGDKAYFADFAFDGIDSVFCSKECVSNEAERQINMLQSKIFAIQNQKFTQGNM